MCWFRIGRHGRLLPCLTGMRPGAVPRTPGGNPDGQLHQCKASLAHLPVIESPFISTPVTAAGVICGYMVIGHVDVEKLIHVLEDQHVGIDHHDSLRNTRSYRQLRRRVLTVMHGSQLTSNPSSPKARSLSHVSANLAATTDTSICGLRGSTSIVCIPASCSAFTDDCGRLGVMRTCKGYLLFTLLRE